MSSVRLPGKVLAGISGKPMLELLLRRLSAAKCLDEIVVATSSDMRAIIQWQFWLISLGFLVYRGSLTDVRSRFRDVGHISQADVLVRITADCPMVDPALVDELSGKISGWRLRLRVQHSTHQPTLMALM
jgi:spore coat polysaccharide biosynthesis protein SpsF (cytidylyltransferase family)